MNIGITGSVAPARTAQFALQRVVAVAVFVAYPGLSAGQAGTHSNAGLPDLMYHVGRWSADDKFVVVSGMTTTGSRILLIPVAGGPIATVDLPGEHLAGADMTVTGEIVFETAPDAATRRRFVMDRSKARRREVARDSVVSATSDSSSLLVESLQGRWSRVVIMNRNRSKSRAVTSGEWAEQPSFSPDGKQIVYERRFDPNRMEASDLVILDSSGAHPRVIASGTDPSWSRDGKQILFKSFDERGDLWISIVDVATQKMRRLMKGVHPQWSNRGERIVYMAEDAGGATHIYTIGVGGGAATCLTCALKTRS